MNKEDREFYLFLRTMPEEDFDNWCETCDMEDLDRAVELFERAKQETREELDSLLDECDDLSLAQNVLKKFTLCGE